MSKKLLDSINSRDGNTQIHPECLPGETFLTNVCKDSNFEKIGWETKRKGEHAYDVFGKLVPDAYPVFIRVEEVLNDPD